MVKIISVIVVVIASKNLLILDRVMFVSNTQTNGKKGKQIYQCLFELKDTCLRNIRFV